MQEITLTDSDREIIVNYQYIVMSVNSIIRCIEWNRQHNLPVLDLPEQARDLKRDLIRFDDLMKMIPNRRERIILRCRYALGMNVQDTAIKMGLCADTICNVTKKILCQNG